MLKWRRLQPAVIGGCGLRSRGMEGLASFKAS
ncbi:hypothetical protein C7449_10920 [Mycoplana dimorpha]|uniref:Uncharacterized protein n=1 Tax=Mycoplana dimorpha TaxID=28320 RepID=A0A2T5AXG7_MYCDI|nr:hypothetical protein C7449_10920 [Mycoplana dimorpha]